MMKIENKEMLLYSAQKAVSTVCRIGGEDVDENEAYFVVGTAVHWMVDCIDRIPKRSIKPEHICVFSAIRCANNCLKHNVTFKEAHKLAGHGYPYNYPYDYGTYFVWTSIDDVCLSESMERQRENYKVELEGKNVYLTLSKILDSVKEYYKDF